MFAQVLDIPATARDTHHKGNNRPWRIWFRQFCKGSLRWFPLQYFAFGQKATFN